MILPSRLLVSDMPSETPVFRRRDGVVSLREYRHDVACLVAVIRSSGAMTAVLYAEDNYQFAVGLLACLYAGIHTVLPNNLCDNIRKQLESPDTVFVHELVPAEAPAILQVQDPARVDVEFFTSGSTGEPKRIIRSFANLEAELQMLEQVFPEQDEPVEVFPTVSFHHAYGIIFGLLLPLSRGMVSDAASFHGLESWLARVELLATPGVLAWVVTTPAFLRVWAENAQQCPLQHRPVRLLSAGAPLPSEVAGSVADVTGAEVYEIFGSSETGVVAHRRPLICQEWQAFREVRIELAGEKGIRVFSPAVLPGEHASLGDSAELLSGGRFRLLPRVDRIVKIADKRVSLCEVEQCLLGSQLVKQAHALVLPGSRVARLAVAVVPSKQGIKVLQEQGYAVYKKTLRDALAQQVEQTLLPRKWRIVGELPVNAQGKVTQAAVAELFDCPLQLPVMLPLSKSADTLHFELLYVRDSAYLAGHFPEYPIVPGVVILQALATLIRNYWGLHVDGIVRLKFSAETLPGHSQLVTLMRKEGSVSVEVLLKHTGGRACQGRMLTSPTGKAPAYL